MIKRILSIICMLSLVACGQNNQKLTKDEQMSDNKVIIYSKKVCPYCVKAKILLKSKNVDFKEIDVADDRQQFEVMLKKSGGRKTVPQIFIGDYHVGGCDDLYDLESQGKLDAMLGK